MSEKLKELISLLYQDNLTQYGKRLLVENIEKLQKENEKLKNNTIKNENELEVGIDCNWDALQKVLDEAEKTNEYIIYDNEKWIKEKYCIPVQKIKDKMKYLDNQQRQWLEDRELKASDSEIIFARDILQQLLEGEE